jgi:hypothetical protein
MTGDLRNTQEHAPSNFQKTEISIAIYLMLLVRKE